MTRDEAARRALETAYPDDEATEVRLRAREADRDVVAVLYRPRSKDPLLHMRRGMPPYRLFAVRRHDLATEELPLASSDAYVLRGIK